MLRKVIFAVLVNALLSQTAVSNQGISHERIIKKEPSLEIMKPFVVHLEQAECCGLDNRVIIAPGKKIQASSNLTELISNSPSVSQNGQGGHFQNFSIRGFSKHRIKTLINGMRIESDRRAGVSASFIEPSLIKQAVVWRTPVSTQFGSGALGGAVEIITKKFETPYITSGFQSNGDENHQVIAGGAANWSFAMARRKAGNARASDGSELNTHFTQYSATMRSETDWQGLNIQLFALPSLAKDIGKSNIDFPERTTSYPEEKHLLLKLSISDDSTWSGNIYYHPNILKTEVHKPWKSINTVSNQANDYGINGSFKKSFGDLDGQIGIDYFSRQQVNASEQSINLVTGDRLVTKTLVDGEEHEGALIAMLSGVRGVAEWQVGARFSYFNQASDTTSQDDKAWSGFLSVSQVFDNDVQVSVNIATGFRFPSLSERMFSGITGRGQVIANPGLKKEQSINIDFGVEWAGSRLVLASNVYYFTVRDYIERVEIEENRLTFLNVANGQIMGIEWDGQYLITDTLTFDWQGHYLKGEDNQGQTLSDIPSNKMILGFNHHTGQWETTLNLEMRKNKDNPGKGEKKTPSAQLLSVGIRYQVKNGLDVSIDANNLLSQKYYNSADRKSNFARQSSIAVNVSWQL